MEESCRNRDGLYSAGLAQQEQEELTYLRSVLTHVEWLPALKISFFAIMQNKTRDQHKKTRDPRVSVSAFRAGRQTLWATMEPVAVFQ